MQKKNNKNYSFSLKENPKNRIIKIIIIIFLNINIFFFDKFAEIIYQQNNNKNSTHLKPDVKINIGSDFPYNLTNVKNLIRKLILFSNQTKQTNIIFADYYKSKSCYDKGAFILFNYYLRNNIDKPYYIINQESDFYKSLCKQNKTKNLILYNEKNLTEFYNHLYEYLKDSKIIINSYSLPLLQKVVSYVPYIKYLKINHGIKHFKVAYAKTEFIPSLRNKMNVICSSPLEYELLINIIKYKSK